MTIVPRRIPTSPDHPADDAPEHGPADVSGVGPLDLAAGKVLFVASTGGHLTELHHLAPAMRPGSDSIWVTFDSEQSRSLLRDAAVRFVPYVRPRGYRVTARAIGLIGDVIRAEQPVAVVST